MPGKVAPWWLRVFAVYGVRCADCRRSDVPLEVHHVNGDPTDNRIRNTIPLCRDWDAAAGTG